MDATTSFRPGTRFAGNAIRVDSFGVEWYSPYRNRNLKDYNTADIGDLDLPIGAVEDALDIVYQTTKQILNDNKIPMMIGGEHLVSYPVIKATYEKYPNLHVIHLRCTYRSKRIIFWKRPFTRNIYAPCTQIFR
jgi:agmatinase